MRMYKKASVFDGMMALGIGLASLIIVFSVMFLIISNTQSQIMSTEGIHNDEINRSTSIAMNATQSLAVAADGIPSWIPLICICVIGSLLIFLVSRFGKGAN